MMELVLPQDQLIAAIADRVAQRMRQPTTGVVSNVDLASQVQTYLAERTRAEATKVEIRRTLGWYLDCCEEVGHAYDSKQAAASFKRALLDRAIHGRTVNNHLMRVSAFLRWAAAHGYVSGDPVDGVKIKLKSGAARDEREAIPTAELVTFLATMNVAEDGRCWLPWILAFTGARLGEISQLYLDDIRQDAKSGIWYFRIDNKLPGQSLKNAQSRRTVPIHSRLLEMRLLERVALLQQEGEERLFPYWSLSNQVPSKYAGRWLRRRLPGGLPHSIRHTVITALYDAGVVESTVSQLAGHTSHVSMSSRYDKGRPLATLRDALEQLSHQ